MADTGTHDTGLGTGTIIAFIAAFVLVGAPMVYYLWSTLNEVLAGHFDGPRLLLSLLILLIFLGVLAILSRSVRRLDARHP
jgi:hypothetical protein